MAFSFKIRSNSRIFVKFSKFVKIRLAIVGLRAHSTGCSGAVPRLMSVATD